MSSKPVLVMKLPERLNLVRAQDFAREIEPLLKADRPRIVFDFCEVRQIDSAGVDMLLHCLEMAMKRDGDLKLATVSPAVSVVLELTRVGRMFEIFTTTSDAVESFHGYPVHGMTHAPLPWYSGLVSGYSVLVPVNGKASDEARLAG